MKKTKEETYQLTFKGFVTGRLDFNDEATKQFLDALELWLRRNDKNAIILNTEASEFETAKVYRQEK